MDRFILTSAINQKSAISHHAISSRCMHSHNFDVCVCGVMHNVCCGVVYRCMLLYLLAGINKSLHRCTYCVITNKCIRNIPSHYYDEYATNYMQNKIFHAAVLSSEFNLIMHHCTSCFPQNILARFPRVFRVGIP